MVTAKRKAKRTTRRTERKKKKVARKKARTTKRTARKKARTKKRATRKKARTTKRTARKEERQERKTARKASRTRKKAARKKKRAARKKPVSGFLKKAADEAFAIVNRNKVVRSLTGVVNVVVYDKSESAPPPGFPRVLPKKIAGIVPSPLNLTFWWQTGALRSVYKGQADMVIGASSWNEALRSVARKVEGKRRKVKIGTLQFWGHGYTAAPLMNGEALTEASFERGSAHYENLMKVKKLMHRSAGRVWFRCCNAFRGKEGKAFARKAVGFFKVPVISHTFVIWLMQSGTQVLRPGKSPSWPSSQGYNKNGTGAPWSDPGRKKTISALKFHPPETAAAYIPGAALVDTVRKIL